MTIFLVGTSHFLVSTSAVQKLSIMTKEKIKNLSIGASGSGAALFVLDDIDVEENDVVFIEYATNDAFYILSGIQSIDRTLRHLGTVAERVVQRGAIPIVYMTPSRLGLGTDLEADLTHRDFCNGTGVPLLDLNPSLRRAISDGCSVDLLLYDDVHQSGHLAARVAELFHSAIARVRTTPQAYNFEHIPSFVSRIILSDNILGATDWTTRSTSLRTARMAVIREGDTFRIGVSDDEFVYGLMINQGAPGAILEFVGPESQRSIGLVALWDNENPRSFMSTYVQLQQPVRGGGDGIVIQILPKGSELTEPLVHRRTLYPELYGELHIEGVVIVRDPDMPVGERPDSAGHNVDILHGLHEQIAADFAAIVSAHRD